MKMHPVLVVDYYVDPFDGSKKVVQCCYTLRMRVMCLGVTTDPLEVMYNEAFRFSRRGSNFRYRLAWMPDEDYKRLFP